MYAVASNVWASPQKNKQERICEDWNKINSESSVQGLVCFPKLTSSASENTNMMIEYYLA